MRKHLALISFYLVCGFTQTATSNAQGLPAYWERDSAMATVESVNIDTAVYELGNISSLADANTTLTGLRNMAIRGDWPLPAREAVIYQFTRSLAGLPRDAVDPDAGAKVTKNPDNANILTALADNFEKTEWTEEVIKETIGATAAQFDLKPGKVMFPLRVLATGVGHGTDLIPTLILIGREETTRRLRSRIQTLFA